MQHTKNIKDLDIIAEQNQTPCSSAFLSLLLSPKEAHKTTRAFFGLPVKQCTRARPHTPIPIPWPVKWLPALCLMIYLQLQTNREIYKGWYKAVVPWDLLHGRNASWLSSRPTLQCIPYLSWSREVRKWQHPASYTEFECCISPLTARSCYTRRPPL